MADLQAFAQICFVAFSAIDARSLPEMQPFSDRHKIAQVVQIQFVILPDLSWRTSYLKPEDFGRQLVISIARAMPRPLANLRSTRRLGKKLT